MDLVTLTFDLLTLKLACESRQRWGTVLLDFGTLGLWLLELFAMYATNGRTDKSNAFPTGRGITILFENGYRIDRKWHHAVTF